MQIIPPTTSRLRTRCSRRTVIGTDSLKLIPRIARIESPCPLVSLSLIRACLYLSMPFRGSPAGICIICVLSMSQNLSHCLALLVSFTYHFDRFSIQGICNPKSTIVSKCVKFFSQGFYSSFHSRPHQNTYDASLGQIVESGNSSPIRFINQQQICFPFYRQRYGLRFAIV